MNTATLETHRNGNATRFAGIISKFYGIGIRMLYARPFAARLQAIYQEWELVVEITPARVITGTAPARVADMVLEWTRQHQAELLENWDRARLGLPLEPIPPLH